MSGTMTPVLMADLTIWQTHWDQGVAYCPLVRASRRPSGYPSRIETARVGDQLIAVLPTGAAREDLWMLGYEDRYLARRPPISEAVASSACPVVCESSLAAWLTQTVLKLELAPPPLPIWLATQRAQHWPAVQGTLPAVIQDSAALVRLYG
jgi:hypothetical protein